MRLERLWNAAPRRRSGLAKAGLLLGAGIALFSLGVAHAEPDLDPDAINARLYEALQPPNGSGRVETVSGQLFVSQENIEADVIREALAALRAAETGAETTVAVPRVPRLNFEIHFPKNSAQLNEASRANLDELARALGDEDYADMRFVLGGHTDLDGDEAVNQPLSEARATAARDYLVRTHGIDGERLVAQGFGTSEPLREVEESAQDKRYNRRVDLRPLRQVRRRVDAITALLLRNRRRAPAERPRTPAKRAHGSPASGA